jgi:hypothetical protein
VVTTTLAPVVAACAFARDDDAAAEEAFAELRRWLALSGHTLAGTKRELYWSGALEVQFPVVVADARRSPIAAGD